MKLDLDSSAPAVSCSEHLAIRLARLGNPQTSRPLPTASLFVTTTALRAAANMVPVSKPKRICFIVVPAIALVAATMNTRSGRGSPEPRHGKPATCHRRTMRISGGVSTESEANAHREWRGPAGQKAGEVPSDPAPAPGRSENSFFGLL